MKKPTTKIDSQNEQIPALSDGEKDTTEVYWPCAPDGYIPNSVVRGFVKPRRPPAGLISRKTRPEVTKDKSTEEEVEEEEDDKDKQRITGRYIFNTAVALYSPLENTLEQKHCTT